MFSLNDSDDTAFVDVLFNTLLVFVVALVLLIPWINPEAKKSESGVGDGNLVIELAWPPEVNADVDLYVLAPGDAVATHFNRKHGPVLDLQRDDLGRVNDPLNINYEVVRSRGIPDGEFAISVQLYGYSDPERPLSPSTPLPATVLVRARPTLEAAFSTLHEARVTLTHVKHEVFVIRLTFADGALVSKSNLPKVLANRWTSTSSL